MDSSDSARQLLKDLFATQLQAVLATDCERQPYTSLMAFAATENLDRLLFATYRDSHKYRNLQTNPRAALLIDNRTCQLSDHFEGVAVTAIGRATEAPAAERDRLLALYLARHPNLAEFVASPACALMTLRVEHYYIVSRFQDVLELALD